MHGVEGGHTTWVHVGLGGVSFFLVHVGVLLGFWCESLLRRNWWGSKIIPFHDPRSYINLVLNGLCW